MSQRQLVAIMFTDIVGYSTLMDQNEKQAFELLAKNRLILTGTIEKYKGKCLKEIGDGTLSRFNSTLDAVNCAMEIQETLVRTDLNLRIGIHLGDVILSKDDVFGEGVNIASRIESLAKPGGICITEAVYDTIRNKPEIPVKFWGEKLLKNIKRQVRVYHIIVEKPRMGILNSIKRTWGRLPSTDLELQFVRPASPGNLVSDVIMKFRISCSQCITIFGIRVNNIIFGAAMGVLIGVLLKLLKSQFL